jgi:transposase
VRRFHALFGVDLTAVPGISVLLVLALLVEVGVDLSAFPSARHFAAWLGLCPHNDRSGGKVLRRRTSPGQSRLKAMLRMCAQSLWQSQSALGHQYRRLKARMGPAAANTAMAHKLARIIWHLVHHQVAYNETKAATLDENRINRQMHKLRRQAQQLGYDLRPLKAA